MLRQIAIVFCCALVVVSVGCSKRPPEPLVVRVALEDRNHVRFTAPGGTLEQSISATEQRGVIKDADTTLESFVSSKDGKTIDIRLELSVTSDTLLYVERFHDVKVTRLGQPQELPVKLKPGRYEFQITAGSP